MKVTLKEFPIYTNDGDTETIYEIECDVTPYDPGRTYGPPEKCYPPEGGECEIVSVKLNGKEIPYELWVQIGLDAKVEGEIEEAVADKLSEQDEF